MVSTCHNIKKLYIEFVNLKNVFVCLFVLRLVRQLRRMSIPIHGSFLLVTFSQTNLSHKIGLALLYHSWPLFASIGCTFCKCIHNFLLFLLLFLPSCSSPLHVLWVSSFFCSYNIFIKYVTKRSFALTSTHGNESEWQTLYVVRTHYAT